MKRIGSPMLDPAINLSLYYVEKKEDITTN